MTFGGFSFQAALEPDDRLYFIDVTQFQHDDFVVDLRGFIEAPVLATPAASRIDVGAIDRLRKPEVQGKRVVLCCRSGVRAWRAARKLQERGFENLALVAMGG